MIENNIFIKKPGYIKVSNERVASMLNISKEEVHILRKEATEYFGCYYPKNKENKTKVNNMFVKQKWTKSNGIETVHYTSNPSSKEEIQDIIKSILHNIKLESLPIYKSERTGNVAVMSIPDVHIGQYVKGQTLSEQIELYKHVCMTLFSDILASNCDEVIFPIGSDYFNVDNKHHTTTNFTQQFNVVNWKEMYTSGLHALIQIISNMSQYMKVTLVCTPGNHDEVLSYTLAETIRLFFETNSNVNLINTDEYRRYLKRGINLLGFTHGKDEKIQNLPNIMAYEAKELWGQCKYMDFFHGHHHTDIMKDIYGVRVIGLPSLALPNEWAKQKGYMSNNGAKAFIYSYINGPVKYIQINT